MSGLILYDVILNQDIQKGYVGFHLENVTWVNSNDSFITFGNVVSATIVSSKLISYCDACSPINIYGIFIVTYSLEYRFLNDITNVKSDYSIVSIMETIFKTNGSVPEKIATENTIIILIKSTFIIESSMSLKTMKFKVANSLIQCPTGKMVRRTLGTHQVFYKCSPTCDGSNKYSLQVGKLMVSEETVYNKPYFLLETFNLSLVSYPPSCFRCPLGAKCEGTIKALPDYWGYVTQQNFISMIRCPDSYCCQGNEACEGIDFCNTGRTGTLCERCEQNLSEALFTTKCLPTESCRTDIVLITLISAVLVYGIVLLSFKTMKDMLRKLFKKGYTMCKEKFKRGKMKRNTTSEQQSKEDTTTDENDFKYMQLLFYYVQDSKLFTVHFPETDTKNEDIVRKFLEFSPDILKAYIQTSELCFAFSNAILKVVLQFSFGFLVINFLLLVYLIQKITSHCLQKNFADLEIKLIQAFLVTILLSYQRLTMGALALVQCVDIRGRAMLLVQADIQCYTWWQIGIIFYVCTCIVPMFFVIAHAPYYVQERRMLVKTFILLCLFPLPVMVMHCVGRYRNRKYFTKSFSIKSEIESLDMLEIPLGEKTETSEKLNSESEHLNPSGISKNLQMTETLFTEAKIEKKINVSEQVSEISSIETDGSENVANNQKNESLVNNKAEQVQIGLENILTEATDEIEFDKHECEYKVLNKDKEVEDKTESFTRSTDEMQKETMSENKDDKMNSCEQMIVECLLKHYKFLCFFGIRFTWLGVHKIYRVVLVVSRNFIADPITRLYTMSTLVTVVSVVSY